MMTHLVCSLIFTSSRDGAGWVWRRSGGGAPAAGAKGVHEGCHTHPAEGPAGVVTLLLQVGLVRLLGSAGVVTLLLQVGLV